MARPRKKDGLKRLYHVGIRLDESEYGKIHAESDKIGATVSAYIRGKALRGFVRVPKQAKVDSADIALLSKLAGLFKKSYTDTGGAYAGQTRVIFDEIRALMLKMNRQVDGDDREAHSESENA
ncbi:MAG: hypothetical protein LBS53_14365 [Synergistaceae bacterium]|jgi:hypothetical protein|nr:hypothetical protein [Synergistaceae bacterium]